MSDFEWTQDPAWKFLRVQDDVLLKDQAARGFDYSSHRWIADSAEGFIAAAIVVINDDKLTVKTPDGKLRKLDVKETQKINPAILEKSEQMADLNFLNEASVLHNLRQRYRSMLTYTYCGQFCVFINPNKPLPLYTRSVMAIYAGRRRMQMPPHIFAVVNETYHNMLHDGQPQSIVLTGESGAGKTGNANAIMHYLSEIASNRTQTNGTECSVGERIIETNRILEAFGNAAAKRNNNSSRFTKFSRIFFNKGGTIVGGNIVQCNLEKSLLKGLWNGERSFHIFHQIISSEKRKVPFSLGNSNNEYHLACSTKAGGILGVSDCEEFERTKKALQAIGLSKEESIDLFNLCAAIIYISGIRFKPKQNEQLAELENIEAVDNAVTLLGLNKEYFLNALVRLSIKVGYESLSSTQSTSQLENTIATLINAIYERLFAWLVERCNTALMSDEKTNSTNYIGILDIAAFEMFEYDSFERLWRNLLNEKVQHYINQHVFVFEQEEYHREALEWRLIDFGHNRECSIDLVEQPFGIISLLEKECAIPNGNEESFVRKVKKTYVGKCHHLINMASTNAKQNEACFTIQHFAGTVQYNTVGWIEKNKEALNESLLSVLKSANRNALLNQIFTDNKTVIDRESSVVKVEPEKSETPQLRSISRTIRGSISNIMQMLDVTVPYFVRCIIPNDDKNTEMIDATIVLNQIAYSGILEGARIFRKGFPNRMEFAKFRHHYSMLAPEESALSCGDQQATEAMLKKLVRYLRIPITHFHIGKTKVLLKSGLATRLEELRDETLMVFVIQLQSVCRCYLALTNYNQLRKKREATKTIQRNVADWINKRDNHWLRLFSIIRKLPEDVRRATDLKQSSEKETKQSTKKAIEQHQIGMQGVAVKSNDEVKRRKTDPTQGDEMDFGMKKVMPVEFVEERKDAVETNRQQTNTKSMLDSIKTNTDKLCIEQLDSLNIVKESETDSLRLHIALLDDRLEYMSRKTKAQESKNADLSDKLELQKIRSERLEEVKASLSEKIKELENCLSIEKETREDACRARKRLEFELKQAHNRYEVMIKQREYFENAYKRKDNELLDWKKHADEDANLITKLQINIRKLISRIEQLEEQLQNEQYAKSRAQQQCADTQAEFDVLNEQVAEAKGQLIAQQHLNKLHQFELSELHRELDQRSASHGMHIANMCSMQSLTLNSLRNLTTQANSLEREASRMLSNRYGVQSKSSIELFSKGEPSHSDDN